MSETINFLKEGGINHPGLFVAVIALICVCGLLLSMVMKERQKVIKAGEMKQIDPILNGLSVTLIMLFISLLGVLIF